MKKIFLALSTLTMTATYAADAGDRWKATLLLRPKSLPVTFNKVKKWRINSNGHKEIIINGETFPEYLLRIKHPDADLYEYKDMLIVAAECIIKKELKVRRTRDRKD